MYVRVLLQNPGRFPQERAGEYRSLGAYERLKFGDLEVTGPDGSVIAFWADDLWWEAGDDPDSSDTVGFADLFVEPDAE